MTPCVYEPIRYEMLVAKEYYAMTKPSGPQIEIRRFMSY